MTSRYHRQMILPFVGEQGQQALLHARVLVVGAGGLGCPCLQYLAATGIGKITVVDGDWIELSNLTRQILFTEFDLGMNKAQVAKGQLEKQNPHIQLHAITEYLNANNVALLVDTHDVIVDCTDDFTTRYLLNDTCVQYNKPYIYAANYQYEGQVAVFQNKKSNLNLRSLFPSPPKTTVTCNEAGALGPVLGILGSMQALEAIKIIIQHPERLIDEMIQLDFLNYSMYRFSISERIIHQDTKQLYRELDITSFLQKINADDACMIDVRQADELPKVDFNHILIPINQLALRVEEIPRDKEIILFCHSGIRSLQALELLQDEFHFENISHLKGGIIKYSTQLNFTHE